MSSSTTACAKGQAPNAKPQAQPTADRPARREREKVLVVLHGDGYVEVFARPHVDVRVAQLLDVHVDDEPAAEEYLEVSLPACYRDLFWPCRLRAKGMVERISPQQELDAQRAVAAIRELRAIGVPTKRRATA